MEKIYFPIKFARKQNLLRFFLLCGKIIRMKISRYIEEKVQQDLEEKMVFI
jgi:hypothetical protein